MKRGKYMLEGIYNGENKYIEFKEKLPATIIIGKTMNTYYILK